ncbi:hypothetical protein [Streptomyces prunicolor]
MSTSATDDLSTRSAECTLAAQAGYQNLHQDCRQTTDIPLPHGGGIVLIARCTCPCHPYIATEA